MDDINEHMVVGLQMIASELRAVAFEKYIKMMGAIVTSETELNYLVQYWIKAHPMESFMVDAADLLKRYQFGKS